MKQQMESANDNRRSSGSELDFGFAFNDSNFSDRLLRIEISQDSPENKPAGDGDGDGEGCINRKRRREEIEMENSSDVVYEPYVDNGDKTNKDDCSLLYRVKNVNISSPILAAQSRFFYKLFSNGMMESEQRYATLQIRASEEDALMDVLNFMYSNTLKASTLKVLLDVLMVADKFEVESCVIYCIRLLKEFPMTLESALVFLDLPSSVLMTEEVRPLIDAAKNFLALRFKYITKFEEELMNLPLAGIEAVLSSNELYVASENKVYDLALKWARTNYPNLEERREVLTSRLCPLIRSPYMTCDKLKEVLNCSDLEPKLVNELLLQAIIFKTKPHYRQALIALANDTDAFHRRCIERAHICQQVQVVEFEDPCKQCIVYWNLKEEGWNDLSMSGRVCTEVFNVGGHAFFLCSHRNMDHFVLSLIYMQDKRSMSSFGLDYVVAFRRKPALEFMRKKIGNHQFTGGKGGSVKLFVCPWDSFRDEHSPFIINDGWHLRVQLTLRE